MLICLAPMDGITDCSYRIVVKEIFDKYNKKDELWLFTEFMSADGFVHSPKGVCKHVVKTEIETPLVAQIFGGNQENLIKTAVNLDTNYNFQGIELNIGCPSPKIMACGGGSGMLKDKKNTLNIIHQLSKSLKSSFSIKTRAGLDLLDKESQSQFIIDSADFCKLITVHGRTFKQSHSGDVDWEFIYNVKQKIGNKSKVVGNGGIKSYEDGLSKVGNLDGIMIGQSAIGNPWILTPHVPSTDELLATILRHLDLSVGFELYFKKIYNDPQENNYETFIIKMPTLANIENEYLSYDSLSAEEKDGIRSAVEFRKHLFSYLKGLPDSKEFKQELIHIREYKQLKNHIISFFEKLKVIN